MYLRPSYTEILSTYSSVLSACVKLEMCLTYWEKADTVVLLHLSLFEKNTTSNDMSEDNVTDETAQISSTFELIKISSDHPHIHLFCSLFKFTS